MDLSGFKPCAPQFDYTPGSAWTFQLYLIIMYVVITSKCTKQSSHSETDSCSADQEITRLLWNPKFHYPVDKNSPLVPILNQIVNASPPYSAYLRSNLTLSSHLRLSSPSCFFRFSGTHLPYAFFIFHAELCLLHPSHGFSSSHLCEYDEDYKLWSCLLCIFSASPSSLGPCHSSGLDGFSRRRPGFDPRSGHVGFMVDNVALWQVFSEYFGCPCQFSFHRLLHTHHHHHHHHLSSGVGAIDQIVADGPSGLSLTPPQEIKKQEVLGRTNRLLFLIRHGPHWKRRVQQFCCCLCIRYDGNVSTQPLPSNDKGDFYRAVAYQR
jgi:hypothetical protein